MLCPRCHTQQEDGRTECEACGVFFDRYRPREDSSFIETEDAEPSWPRFAWTWLMEHMFVVQPGGMKAAVLVRGGFLLVLALWTIRLMMLPIEGEELVGSVMHLIHLPFHEAGHVVFSFFGRFLHVLGGTLGQLLVPMLVVGSFLAKDNPFGATVGTWWLGQSFMDCAPYIGDARAGELTLLGGVTGQEMPGYHDWEVLLGMTGLLHYDHALARLAWTVGVALMLGALVWAGYLVWKQWRLAEL